MTRTNRKPGRARPAARSPPPGFAYGPRDPATCPRPDAGDCPPAAPAGKTTQVGVNGAGLGGGHPAHCTPGGPGAGRCCPGRVVPAVAIQFGAIVAAICIYEGVTAHGGAEGVAVPVPGRARAGSGTSRRGRCRQPADRPGHCRGLAGSLRRFRRPHPEPGADAARLRSVVRHTSRSRPWLFCSCVPRSRRGWPAEIARHAA